MSGRGLVVKAHAPGEELDADERAAVARIWDAAAPLVDPMGGMEALRAAIAVELRRARRLGAFEASGDLGVLEPGDR